MKCRTVIDVLSSSVDKRVSGTELRELEAHLSECPACALRFHQLRTLRTSLRSLPVLTPPRELTTRLRVIASQERARHRRHASVKALLRYWDEAARVWIHNMMRPLALPFAGGLLSAVVLFSMIAPMYGNQDRHNIRDVPTMLTTAAALKSSTASFGIFDQDIVVDVLVDGHGRMLDYSVPPGQVWQLDPELRRSVENALLCTQFTPATMFGVPKSGRLRISFRGNRVEVKG